MSAQTRKRFGSRRPATTGRQQALHQLRLCVAGMTSRSARAIRHATRLCEHHLGERYRLEIIDIHQKPALLKGEQIVAIPTLIKHLPLPLRRFVGDMHNVEKLLFGPDLRSARGHGGR